MPVGVLVGTGPAGWVGNIVLVGQPQIGERRIPWPKYCIKWGRWRAGVEKAARYGRSRTGCHLCNRLPDWSVGTDTSGWSKKLTPFVLFGFFYALISSIIDRFSNLFHCLNQENISSNNVAIDPTTPQVYCYTTLWNVSVLKATTENKTSSVATRFKKLTTGNNVFIVSVII